MGVSENTIEKEYSKNILTVYLKGGGIMTVPCKFNKAAGLIFVMLFIFSATGVIFAQDSSLQPITIVVNGNIIKGGMLKSGNIEWIEVQFAVRVIEALGASSAFDGEANLLAVNLAGEVKELTPEGAVPEKPFIVVVNGRIYKTSSIWKDSKVLMPLAFLKKIMEAFGCSAQEDKTVGILTFTGMRNPSSDVAASGGGDQSERAASSLSGEPIGEQERKEKSKFLKSLDGIIAETALTPDEQNELLLVFLGLDVKQIKTEVMNTVKRKYDKAVNGLKKLAPPDAETANVRDMAVGLFNKISRLVELVGKAVKEAKGAEDQETVLEIRKLGEEIAGESREFEKKLYEIKKRYE